MDAGSIDLIMTALAAAAGAGIVGGVQDAAGKAVGTAYDAFAGHVANFLRHPRSLAERQPPEPDRLTPEQLLSEFRDDPDSCRAELEAMLAMAPELDDELRALAEGQTKARQQQTLIKESDGVLVSYDSYQPTQTNYFGSTSRAADPSTD